VLLISVGEKGGTSGAVRFSCAPNPMGGRLTTQRLIGREIRPKERREEGDIGVLQFD